MMANEVKSNILNQCLHQDWTTGEWRCKQCAPFTLSDIDKVEENGSWYPQQTYGFVNNYNPNLLVYLCCNHDIKLLTNGKDTKNVCWYITKYATKAQSKMSNLSALLAQNLQYHLADNKYFDVIQERNQLLVFCCFMMLNHNNEQSAPQVISYLMGWGDSFKSHHYVPLYWTTFSHHLEKEYPDLKKSARYELAGHVHNKI